MITTTLNVADMHCSSCSNKIINALTGHAAVASVNVNPLHRRVFVTHADGIDALALMGEVERLGFHPELAGVQDEGGAVDRAPLKRLGVAGLCMMQVMMLQIALYAGAFDGMDAAMHRLLSFAALLFTIPVVTYSAVPFFRRGFGFLRSQGVNMDTPIALAITIAFLTSAFNTLSGNGEVYFDSVVMFSFLMLGARYLDERLRRKLRVQDEVLANLPREVQRLDADGNTVSVDLAQVVAGDVLWIPEGAMVPADGTLLETSATINEAFLSGEAEPRQHSPGATLYAGTINEGAGLKLSVTAPGKASRLARIDRLAARAQTQKGSLTRLSDRVAKVFVPAILALAAGTYLVWWWLGTGDPLSATLAVLVVSCPCALSLAAPAAVTAALTNLRRRGLLVRNAHAVERLASLTRVFFDKTGTLTTPQPVIVQTITLGAWDAATCLRRAAALQAHSQHPLARAFRQAQTPPADDVVLHPSQGLSGRVDGERAVVGNARLCGCPGFATDLKTVYLAIAGRPAAVFLLDTPLREDAASTVAELQRLGLAPVLLSGDKQTQCQRVARALAIPYRHDASPEDKEAAMRRDRGSLFVGDGLNDLPALATADVSVATLETVDLVKARADVLLMRPRLGALPELFRVARYTRRVMRQNLAWALLYNVLAIPAAAAGLATPWLAALGMSASSLLVMLNATRVLRAGSPAEIN